MLVSRAHALVGIPRNSCDLVETPWNPWWSQLLFQPVSLIYSMSCGLDLRRKLILALFLYTNGECFDLLCILELL